MTEQIVTVDGKAFLARIDEQDKFRAALREVYSSPADEKLPYIVLLSGDGGIGKTTLAKRFRDIALEEAPFEGEFQVLWVDWEEESKRFAGLQVGRVFIRPETVYDAIYAVALRRGWEKYFKAYQKAREQRQEVEKEALKALAPQGDKDEFGALRSAGAALIANLIRLNQPEIGDTGEKLAQAFLEVGIKTGAEQVFNLRSEVEARVRALLTKDQFELFTNPNEKLARALADGLERVAERRPLIVVLDTYEIVDRTDFWVREVMRSAGPRLAWVLSGRNNLYESHRFAQENFKGYRGSFSKRLLYFDLRQLAKEDLQTYFSAHVPERSLQEAEAETLTIATRGIPLAIEQAAELWARGVTLDKIVGDTSEATPRGKIVSAMTERYLLHVVTSEDKIALFALALADGDLEILHAMLRPDENSSFDLESRLQSLARNYASVHRSEARLHEEPAVFFR